MMASRHINLQNYTRLCKHTRIVIEDLHGSEKRHKKIAIQLLRKTTVWRKSDLSGKIHALIGFRNFILTLVFRGCQEYFILQ